MGRDFFEELIKKGGPFWNDLDASMLFSQHLNWNLLVFLPELSHFDFEDNSYKQIIKISLVNLSKFLDPTENDFSVNFWSS